MSKKESIPRYRILIQDEITQVQIAAGSDNIDQFTKTDLMKFVKHFKEQIKKAETPLTKPILDEVEKRKNNV